jgi:SAM-dependent MidA family methyltransferase
VPEIATILRNLMRINGIIPFSQFMETALYCPHSGYYERPEVSPGRKGDFFTSVSVGPLFGQLLAARFAGWLAQIPGKTVQLVEAGAHDGRLARDILAWFQGHHPEVWSRLEYGLIEPSRRRRTWQATQLQPFADRVRWFQSPEELGHRGVHGVIFSNELLDAFPVTRLQWCARTRSWRELGVTLGANGYQWATMPETAGERTAGVLEDAGLKIPGALAEVLPDGFQLDLAEGAATWWRAAARALAQGHLLTFDYGLAAEELLSPSRATGTLRGYRNHRQAADVLADPGEQDLTSHVNFTQLQRAGEAEGLRSDPLEGQAQFLMRIMGDGSLALPAEQLAGGGARQLQTLVHPEHLGSRFRVLVQRREEIGNGRSPLAGGKAV